MNGCLIPDTDWIGGSAVFLKNGSWLTGTRAHISYLMVFGNFSIGGSTEFQINFLEGHLQIIELTNRFQLLTDNSNYETVKTGLITVLRSSNISEDINTRML